MKKFIILLGLWLAAGGAASAQDFPSIKELEGVYGFSSAGFNLANNSFRNYLKGEFEFTVDVTADPIVVDFIYQGLRSNAEYDASTGELTFKTLTLQPDGRTWLGVAPVDKGWGGISALYGNCLKWQVDAEGGISIPDFEIITYSGSTKTGTVATYAGNSVEWLRDLPADGEDTRSFEGVYSLTGTRYDYLMGTGADPVKSALDFDLVINADNQITAIAGYTLDRQQVEVNKRNRGAVNGNTLTLDSEPFNGVIWEQVITDAKEGTGYTDSYIFGGSSTRAWIQGSTAISFTVDDDGGYRLAPFTLWHRYRGTNSEGNEETVAELVFRWDDSPFAEVGDPAVRGLWSTTLDNHYTVPAGEFEAGYEVTLLGNTVIFSGVGQQDFYGEFTDGQTILFSRRALDDATSPLYQMPYVNASGTDDMEQLAEQPFTATFNAATGTITFPEGSGLLYGYANAAGRLTSRLRAYDFATAMVKTSELDPEITLGSHSYATTGDGEVTITVELQLTGLVEEEVGAWKANITEQVNDNDNDDSYSKYYSVEALVDNGTATFTVDGLARGHHDLTYSIAALDADGRVIALSTNERSITVQVGGEIVARKVKAEVIDGAIVVSFTHSISGIDLDTAAFKARFTDQTTITDDNPSGTAVETEVELDHKAGTGTARLEGLSAGTYDHYVTLAAYSAAGQLLAESNRLDIRSEIETTGIDALPGESAEGDTRYFNLRGVEVRNPKAGTIVIKVTDGKARKVIVK